MALRHRQLSYGFPVPQDFLDALQDFLGPALNNLRLTILNPTTLQIPAAGTQDQVSVGIMGRWRFITAGITAAHPGGAAGQYDVYVTGSDNSFTVGGPSGEIDTTDYSFGLVIRAQGAGGSQSPPATALYRKIAECTWNGSAITAITMTQGTTAIGLATPLNRGEMMILGGLA
jgi:hypothetical protein